MTPRRARILIVPYDSGQRGFRMGAGPKQLMRNGLAERVARLGFDVTVEEIDPSGSPPHPEIATSFELARIISDRVHAAQRAGETPLVFSGNCNTSLGTVSGLDRNSRGVIWFDAHGDFNTPDTTIGGFLDGMALAALTGRCWKGPTATIPRFEAVQDESVIQLGARHLDPAEAELLRASKIGRAGADASDSDVDVLLDRLSTHVDGAYLHLDLDVLDVNEGKANSYACAGGYTRRELNRLLDRIAEKIPIKAMAVTAYDPALDADKRVAEAAMEFVETVLKRIADPTAPARRARSSPSERGARQ